jgi:putative ABC transport system ATP-binding protein
MVCLVSWQQRPEPDPDDTYIDLELAPRRRPRPPAAVPTAAAPPVLSRPATAVGVHVRSASFVRAGQQILDSVSVSVAAGQALALVGPSGSGKSSLLALMAGLERPDAGEVIREPAVGVRVGLVLQGYGLVSVLTAAENVEVPLQAGVAGPMSRRDIAAAAAAALASVGLTEVSDHLVEELSGGQQQRVAIARALAISPDLLLADEPTAELDREMKERVVDLLMAVAGRGGAVVVATHDPEIAARCGRQVRLTNGSIAESQRRGLDGHDSRS